ncbi:MAG: hypothetical protein HZA31_11130 [Opitutae bacterium]|nr:hypothetical protein [Opitutae bacterium]
MGLKIKWSDDRVREATTALVLIARDRLRRGLTADLIAASLADYRNDPAGFRKSQTTWAATTDVKSLTNPQHAAQYKKLLSRVDDLVRKMTQGKRQFSSLAELDNFLVFTLGNAR